MSTSVIGLFNGIAMVVYPAVAGTATYFVTGDIKKAGFAAAVTAVVVNGRLREDPGTIPSQTKK